MNNRTYGKCECGMWTSILSNGTHELTKTPKYCWVCQREVRIWYHITDYRIWYKPWTWNERYVTCSSCNNGWASQSLPKELWGM